MRRQPTAPPRCTGRPTCNDADSVSQLIRAGANVNVRNNYGVSPMALAARQGNATIIDQLMKAGADPNDTINYINAG